MMTNGSPARFVLQIGWVSREPGVQFPYYLLIGKIIFFHGLVETGSEMEIKALPEADSSGSYGDYVCKQRELPWPSPQR